MNRIKKACKILFASVASFYLGLAVHTAGAAIYDGVTDLGRLNWFGSGVLEFVQHVDTGGNLVFRNVDVPAGTDVYISTGGSLGIPRMTSAQIAAYDPINEGELVWNSDRNVLCASTSAVTGAFAIMAGVSTHTAAIYAAGVSSATSCGPQG